MSLRVKSGPCVETADFDSSRDTCSCLTARPVCARRRGYGLIVQVDRSRCASIQNLPQHEFQRAVSFRRRVLAHCTTSNAVLLGHGGPGHADQAAELRPNVRLHASAVAQRNASFALRQGETVLQPSVDMLAVHRDPATKSLKYTVTVIRCASARPQSHRSELLCSAHDAIMRGTEQFRPVLLRSCAITSDNSDRIFRRFRRRITMDQACLSIVATPSLLDGERSWHSALQRQIVLTGHSAVVQPLDQIDPDRHVQAIQRLTSYSRTAPFGGSKPDSWTRAAADFESTHIGCGRLGRSIHTVRGPVLLSDRNRCPSRYSGQRRVRIFTLATPR